jgi:hypothetical protein
VKQSLQKFTEFLTISVEISPSSPSTFTPDQVMATLQADLPHLFERDISYTIYTRDVFFQDPVNTFRGKVNYRIIFWTLRFHGRLFFTDLHFDVHQIQAENPQTIRVDWTVRGTLRLPWHPRLLFNGYSLYQLDQQGLIYNHRDTWDRSPQEILRQFIWGAKDCTKGDCQD